MGKANYLENDFKEICTNSDDAVFELLKEKERAKPQKPSSQKQIPRDNQRRRKKPHRPTTENLKQWGKPIAILNTRIPQELSDLIDDLVYQSKKDQCPTTKQAITIQALKEFVLSKQKLNRSNTSG